MGRIKEAAEVLRPDFYVPRRGRAPFQGVFEVVGDCGAAPTVHLSDQSHPGGDEGRAGGRRRRRRRGRRRQHRRRLRGRRGRRRRLHGRGRRRRPREARGAAGLHAPRARRGVLSSDAGVANVDRDLAVDTLVLGLHAEVGRRHAGRHVPAANRRIDGGRRRVGVITSLLGALAGSGGGRAAAGGHHARQRRVDRSHVVGVDRLVREWVNARRAETARQSARLACLLALLTALLQLRAGRLLLAEVLRALLYAALGRLLVPALFAGHRNGEGGEAQQQQQRPPPYHHFSAAVLCRRATQVRQQLQFQVHLSKPVVKNQPTCRVPLHLVPQLRTVNSRLGGQCCRGAHSRAE
eukprot:scaffold80958_cov66-Phaeocystis_antarctica.AAC.1